ncbi:MAG: hypothetical protein GYB25_10845, partial [Rhodobacteraceae bacterium]|nr:hypothetical protein [Paracoccaceae bacterium]
VSDYGYSILRPVVGLALWWVLPAFVYLFVFVWGDVMADRFDVSLKAFGFSFANLFKFFGFQRLYFSAEFGQDLNGWLQFLSALQTIAGFVFLFFLGLGLRQRFRLR